MRIVSGRWVFALLTAALAATVAATPAHAILAFSAENRLTEPGASGPFGVASADFDADGNADIVIANKTANSITVLLGNGSGTFTQFGANIAVGSSPLSVATGDCGNGNQSIFVGNYGSSSVTVIKNTTTGGVLSFAAGVSYGAGTKPVHIISRDNTDAALDIDGDGKLDLAFANKTTDRVSTLRGNGDCTFGTVNSTANPGNGPETLAAGDFNGDGKVDLVATRRLTPPGISVLLNDGTGLYPASCPSTLCKVYNDVGTPANVATAFLDGPSDTVLDLLIANTADDKLSRKGGNGDGTFGGTANFDTANPLGTGRAPEVVLTGLFDGDTLIDAITVNKGSNTISFMKGQASANFAAGVTYPLNNGNPAIKATGPEAGVAFVAGSLNVATVNNTTNSYSSCVNNGSGAFTCTASTESPSGFGSGPHGIAIANVTGDVNNDIVVANDVSDDMTILIGNGGGGFSSVKPRPPIPPIGGALTPRDVVIFNSSNGGGADLAIAACGGTGQTKDKLVVVRDLNFDPNSAPAAQAYGAGDCPTAVATGLFHTGDSNPDIVVANQNWNSLSVFKDVGLGVYQKMSETCIAGGTPPSTCTACYPLDVAVGEFGTSNADDTPDSLEDVVVTCRDNDTFNVFFSNGSWGFKAGIDNQSSINNGKPQSLDVADFNGDGKLDIAVGNHNTAGSGVGTPNGVQVFLAVSANHFNNVQNLDAGKQPTALVSADLGAFGTARRSLIATAEGSDQVAFFESRGPTASPMFEAALVKAVGTNPAGVAVGNLDADAKLDVVVSNNGTDDLSVFFNQSPLCGDNTTASPEACDPPSSSCNTGCGTGTCTVTCRCSP